jgi:tRNA(Ile)-lysidine synthase TilS/MesJ
MTGDRAKTRVRRALQPLWNALDAISPVVADGAVLAVSGGCDSRALLEAWARWPRRPPRPPLVVSVDHGRRPGAADEADAVVTRATALGMQATTSQVRPHRGDEASLRRARHSALRAAARHAGCGAVVFAHHRGDVAEGLLLHLSGLGGGRGGSAPAIIEPTVDGIAAVRPFLALPKSVLQAALAALGVTDVVIDEDDRAGKNARGWLRQQVFEPLRGRRSTFEEALARHARHVREDDDVLSALVPDADIVDATLAPALLRRWLRRQIARFESDPRTSPDAIDAVLRHAAAGSPAVIPLRGCRAQIRRRAGGHEVAVIAAAPHDVR